MDIMILSDLHAITCFDFGPAKLRAQIYYVTSGLLGTDALTMAWLVCNQAPTSSTCLGWSVPPDVGFAQLYSSPVNSIPVMYVVGEVITLPTRNYLQQSLERPRGSKHRYNNQDEYSSQLSRPLKCHKAKKPKAKHTLVLLFHQIFCNNLVNRSNLTQCSSGSGLVVSWIGVLGMMMSRVQNQAGVLQVIMQLTKSS